MIEIRKSKDRGHANHGWLDTYHTFSFGDYYDQDHVGFSVLRVINEDRIQGGKGFETHPHQNMEIISYVVEGALEHIDSMGNRAVIKPGEVQRMSAGTGVEHSERNPLAKQPTHLLQIWILPDTRNIPPSYAQKMFFSDGSHHEGPLLVVSKEGRQGSITIHQDIEMHIVRDQKAGEKLFTHSPNRHFWLQVVKGEVTVGENKLTDGDGAGIKSVPNWNLQWKERSEFLLFDLP